MIARALAASAVALLACAHARAETPLERAALQVLQRHCSVCHGAHAPEAGLDVRSLASLLRGGKSGPAIVPGKPGESLVLKRIRAGEMPPRAKLVEACVKPVDAAGEGAIERWIVLGAPEGPPDVVAPWPDPLVTDRDRAHWAFRPPRAAPPPAVKAADRVRNPIDAFLLEKLEARGLSFAPEADRLTLLRRASLDVTGLPPEPEEARAFEADQDPLAYEKLVDRLLASPRYGERWGRHWLDLAGYADSEGKREQDLPRTHAYRYRDYVIRSLNADKPYDRFLLEQIAGDELAPYEGAGEVTQEVSDNIVATGFLRMAPDATWANITGFLEDRVEVIADDVDVLGSAVMGLTVKCARCHDHKLEPIPQRDYYRLRDVLKGALDEHDWLKPEIHPGIGPVSADRQGSRTLACVPGAERREWEEHEAAVAREVAAAKSGPQNAETERRVRDLEAGRRPEPRIQALWDRGDPSPTYVYARGDCLKPTERVGPGVPSVLVGADAVFTASPPWPGAKSTGRRLAFARWLTRPDHPLTARVAVNRLWKLHFGAGIVATLENFGKSGAPPTHPELLDWLATELPRRGWSLKAMHRLILTSRAYRQSSRVTEEGERLDPEGSLLSRMPLRRLDAEEVHDALLLAAGRLDETLFGPAVPFDVRADGLVTPVGTSRGWRRGIYLRQERKHRPTLLEDFGLPTMSPNCTARRPSNTAAQALHLMNSAWIDGLAASFAERVEREAGEEPAKQVERAHWILLSRPPGPDEAQAGTAALLRLRDASSAAPAEGGGAARRALSAYCHALLNSAAFLYVD